MALENQDSNMSGLRSAVRDAWLSANHMPLFTQRSPFLKMLQVKGSIKPAGYGTTMREPLMVPVLTGPQLEGVSNAYAEVAPQAMTGYTSANYPLSQYMINVSWDLYQDRQAGGETEMVRWNEAHFKNAELRAFNKILSHLWAIPENVNSAGAREQLASIRTFINGGSAVATGTADPPAQASQSVIPLCSATSATAVTIVGGIQRSAAGAAYWCPPILMGGATASAALTVMLLNDLYEEAFQEGEEPDLILMPPGLFSKITNLMTVGGGNGGQMYGESRLAKLGFSAIRYRNAEIAVDRRVPTAAFNAGSADAKTNHIYCLNLSHIMMRMVSKKPVFEKLNPREPIHEERGLWYLALTADHLGNVHSLGCNYTQ